jgi:CRP-like cAMP-binding protein
VAAVERAEVAVLDKAAFDGHLQAHPSFARALLELVARRMRDAVQKEEP